MGGRPRTPTKLLEMGGAFRKNPSRLRARKREPKPKGGLGDPPVAFMRPDGSYSLLECMAWQELKRMLPKGVLTMADRFWCERTCILMAKSRLGTLKGSDEASLARYLGKLGLNPSDRSSLDIPEPVVKDDLDTFVQGRKSG